jgi:protein subunit release factor A
MVSTVFDDKYRIFLGTHRIQRVSATEKQGRRHTSFVEVYEVITTKTNAVWRDSDVRIETFRGSGAGGQHRNKTDSCVRMTHIPTGITAIATEQRSQHQNKKVARSRLQSRIGSGSVDQDRPVDQQWNWCEWRDKVILPNGKKMNMTNVMKKGV